MEIMKNNTLKYTLIGLGIVILIVVIYLVYKNQKEKKSKLARDNSVSDKGINTEIDFSDPDTYEENALKNPRKFRRWLRDVKRKAEKYGEGLPEDKYLKWRKSVAMVIKDIEKNPTSWIQDWLDGYVDSPEQAIATSLIWAYSASSFKCQLSKDDLIKISNAAGLEVHPAVLEMDCGNNKSSSSKQVSTTISA